MRHLALAFVLTLVACNTVFAQEPAPDRAAAARSAQAAFDAKKWDEAATAYRVVVKASPEDAVAWHNLGYALHMQGKYDEAVEAHLQSAKFPRTKASGFYNAACAYALTKKPDLAFENLGKAAAAGFSDEELLASDTDLASLRSDPRWAGIVEAVRKAGAASPGRAVAYGGERKGSRVLWFGGGAVAAQAVIDYGPVAWKDDYTRIIESKKVDDRRWRLGKDFWTTYDANLPVTFGSTKVPPGYYYLTLMRTAEGAYVLAFNDADAIRKARLDPFQAESTKGGLEVPLTHEALATPEAKLDIALTLDAADNSKGTLTIRFGPHKLSAAAAYEVSPK
jgi:hypothetical protein